MSTNLRSPSELFTGDDSSLNSSEEDNEISLSEFEAFTGRGSYPLKLKAFQSGQRNHAGFNWWAALFGAHWFAFRKLYFYALAALLIEFAFPLLIGFVCGMFLGRLDSLSIKLGVLASFILARLLIGSIANIALTLKAVESIRKVDALNLDNDAHLRQISLLGGVSVGALLLVYLGLAIVQILF